ncbi:MAG: hypothetical protein ABI806_17390 [Candidatus Solibacter sp.]
MVMILGVWVGFAGAIRFADSPGLYAAVGRVNHALSQLNFEKFTATPECDALIVAADRNTELTSVATLSPRGYHPVVAAGAKDALERVRTTGHLWKLVVIDASLPGAATLTRALREQLPAANIVAVQGRSGAQAVSRMLMERLSTPARETVAN